MSQEHYEQLKEKATIAYKNKLFVKNQDYLLREILQAIRYSEYDKLPNIQVPNVKANYWEDIDIKLEYRDDTAVGVAIINNKRNELIAIYVKYAYRRQGIASKLCEEETIVSCNEGTREGNRFFSKMGYDVFEA